MHPGTLVHFLHYQYKEVAAAVGFLCLLHHLEALSTTLLGPYILQEDSAVVVSPLVESLVAGVHPVHLGFGKYLELQFARSPIAPYIHYILY